MCYVVKRFILFTTAVYLVWNLPTGFQNSTKKNQEQEEEILKLKSRIHQLENEKETLEKKLSEADLWLKPTWTLMSKSARTDMRQAMVMNKVGFIFILFVAEFNIRVEHSHWSRSFLCQHQGTKWGHFTYLDVCCYGIDLWISIVKFHSPQYLKGWDESGPVWYECLIFRGGEIF